MPSIEQSDYAFDPIRAVDQSISQPTDSQDQLVRSHLCGDDRTALSGFQLSREVSAREEAAKAHISS